MQELRNRIVQGDCIIPFKELKENTYYKDRVFFYNSYNEIREKFLSLLEKNVKILIKGSNGTNLYKLIEEVENGYES